ncbi:MAG: hypothetical protein LBK60_05720, partial [Verrucomicrobiales bacterium]|nr:hypothetical protein [Verrucomicrobiales bacterium]
HALAYQAAATDIAHVRTSDKDRAAWTPASQTFIIEPNTTKAGPIANETGTGGFFPLAIVLNDELFAGTKLTADIKAALRLNPLSKHEQHGGADGKPNYSALIKENHLTIAFLKEDFVRMLAKIDHGTGTFDTEYTLTRSPFIDPHPLPKGEPKIWRVQLFGFFKHTPITDEGIPGDIIDVAAKAYLAEHSEGAA